MAGLIGHHPRAALVLDLDEGLLDRREAWLYAVEESVAATTGRRISARPLLDEYRLRPMREALRIILPAPPDSDRCEALAGQLYYRSALKRLLVHDGIGMALDAVREQSFEIGAISREPHAVALKQVQATGLDRFVIVLSATPPGEAWDPAARVHDCLAFLEQEPHRAVFVSPIAEDLPAVEGRGVAALLGGWGTGAAVSGGIPHPSALLTAVRGHLHR